MDEKKPKIKSVRLWVETYKVLTAVQEAEKKGRNGPSYPSLIDRYVKSAMASTTKSVPYPYHADHKDLHKKLEDILNSADREAIAAVTLMMPVYAQNHFHRPMFLQSAPSADRMLVRLSSQGILDTCIKGYRRNKMRVMWMMLASASLGWGGTATFECVATELTFGLNAAGAVAHTAGESLCYIHAPKTPDSLIFRVQAVGAFAGSGAMFLDGVGGSLRTDIGSLYGIAGNFLLMPDGSTSGAVSYDLILSLGNGPPATQTVSKSLSGTYARQSLPNGYRVDFDFPDAASAVGDVPEPSSVALTALALIGMIHWRARHRRSICIGADRSVRLAGCRR